MFASLLGGLAAAAPAGAQTFSYEFVPTATWYAGLKSPIIAVNASGVPTPAMDQVSTYIQGSWKLAEWNSTSVAFQITTPSAGLAGIDVMEVAASGSNGLAIYDGLTLLDQKTYTAAGTFEVPIPAGAHQIRFVNTGQDWLNVRKFYFRDSSIPPPAPGQVTGFQWAAPTVATYARAEGTFSIDKTYSNPYDPAVVSVDALVSGPNGASFTMPAFWWEEVTWEQRPLGSWANFNAPVAGSGRWKVRLAFPAVGTWSVAITVRDAGGTTTSAPQTIEVTEGGSEGFVRMDPSDRQGFRFDGGAPYIPVGFNLCWSDGELGTFYDFHLGKMQENGVTWMRYWMVPFARQSIEWADDYWFAPYAGLGRYSQEAAAFMDDVVGQAEARGVYIQVVLEQMNAYSTSLNSGSGWAENPFNTAKGGWLASPAAWFTDAQAIEMTERKYRYIVARWGYSTHILAWELFNEYNFCDGSGAEKAFWHKAMSTYLKEVDPYRHLVTSSSTREELLLLDSHPDMDVMEEHIYADPIAQQLDALDGAMLAGFTKPVLVGEYGSRGEFQDTLYEAGHPDLWGDHVRQSSWIGSMNRVPNMFWFWGPYLQDYNLFGLYKPLTDFWVGEDPGRQPGLGVATFSFEGAPPNLQGLTLSPGAGWDQGLINPVIALDATGTPNPTMANVSSFLRGSYHASASHRVTFSLNTLRAGKAGLQVSGLSSSGTKIVRIVVDSVELGRKTFTAAGTLEVDLPAGPHTVMFENLGQDWATVSQFYFRGFDAGPVTQAHGFMSSQAVYAYVLDQAFGEWAATAETRAGVSLVVDGIPGGTWQSSFVHPTTGVVESGPVLAPSGGRIVVPLPAFTKDIAVKLKRQLIDPPPPANRLLNISLRAKAGIGDETCITGFVITGGERTVLLRAAGPALLPHGVVDAAADPRLTLMTGGNPVGSNDDWGSVATAPLVAQAAERVGAFAFADGSSDAALVITLAPGAYTVHANSADNQGVVLAEVYDASPETATGAVRIVNLSSRVFVGAGEKIAIAGFVHLGAWPRTVLVRAVGPGLAAYGVNGTLANPRLVVYAGSQSIASNDEWGSAGSSPLVASAGAQVGAFALPDGSQDAALLVQLGPGLHTVHVSGADGGTGVALVEVYDVPDMQY